MTIPLSDVEVQKLLAAARCWADDSWYRNKQTSWQRYGTLIQALEEVNKERELFRQMLAIEKEYIPCPEV
jgi:hypothetical protein